MPEISLEHRSGYWVGTFSAMASPCEVLMEVENELLAQELLEIAQQEALRIESKFSRYRDDNQIFEINNSDGNATKVDDELAALLDYADHCYRLSEGSFDITSGILRRAWHFNGSDQIPSQKSIDHLLKHIGWDKVNWHNPYITLPVNMEIDLGAIGKEYAVDQTALLLKQHTDANMIVNYGGDLYCTGPRRDGSTWTVGIDSTSVSNDGTQQSFELGVGGIATSGDERRFLVKNGVRYGHILDPRTGWPTENAPRMVTVLASTCTEAGILSTLAMLQGAQAEAFLALQQVQFRINRD
ncbi:MAG: FAD:protein FMN transferase [Gammaproteobacteria bacterium]